MEEEKSFRYIKFFDDVRSNDVAIVGGKNASLGELLSFGIPVPLGFAVTADAYDYILETNYFRIKDEEITLKNYIKRNIDKITEELKKEDIKSIQKVDKFCADIRYVIEQAKIPDSLADEIIEAYHILTDRIGSESTFAIRSSATAEDLPDASFAGQQDTHLNISGENQVLEYILKDMASIFTTRATMYRERAGFDHFTVKLSVGVQEIAGGLNGVKSSGVMFTEDPDSGNPNVVVIRGTWGLGELIVQGAEKGDEFIVFKHGPKLQIISRELVKKEQMMIFYEKGGTITLPVELEKQKPHLTIEKRTEEAIHDVAQKYAIKTSVEEALNPANKLQAAKTPAAIGLAELGLAYCAIRYGPDIICGTQNGSPESSAANADAIYKVIANTSSMDVETIITETNNSWGMEQISKHGITKVAASNVNHVGDVASHINDTTAVFTANNISFNEPLVGEEAVYNVRVVK